MELVDKIKNYWQGRQEKRLRKAEVKECQDALEYYLEKSDVLGMRQAYDKIRHGAMELDTPQIIDTIEILCNVEDAEDRESHKAHTEAEALADHMYSFLRVRKLSPGNFSRLINVYRDAAQQVKPFMETSPWSNEPDDLNEYRKIALERKANELEERKAGLTWLVSNEEAITHAEELELATKKKAWLSKQIAFNSILASCLATSALGTSGLALAGATLIPVSLYAGYRARKAAKQEDEFLDLLEKRVVEDFKYLEK
jgi:hypothetical protein